MSGSQKGRAECSPDRVVVQLDALWSEFLQRCQTAPGPSAWAELAEEALWMSGWHGRFRRQWSLLGEWARQNGQPRAVVRAILAAEHDAGTRELRQEIAAARYEREASRRTRSGRPVCEVAA